MNTDDAPADIVLKALQLCAFAWEPNARLLGNIRAVDISRACEDAIRAIDLLRDYRRAEEAQAEEDHAAYGARRLRDDAE